MYVLYFLKDRHKEVQITYAERYTIYTMGSREVKAIML